MWPQKRVAATFNVGLPPSTSTRIISLTKEHFDVEYDKEQNDQIRMCFENHVKFSVFDCSQRLHVPMAV